MSFNLYYFCYIHYCCALYNKVLLKKLLKINNTFCFTMFLCENNHMMM